jgi:CRISPR-associated protein Csh1
MLDAMRQLALSRLWLDLGDGTAPDPEAWYRQLRERDLGRLFPYLVEDMDDEGKGQEKPRYYTLRPDPKNDHVAVLEAHELKQVAAAQLPFNQPSGSQSAALGPVVKRTPRSKKKPAGPSVKIQQTTLKAFKEIAEQGQPWSEYFAAARECWTRPKLRFGEREVESVGGAFQAAIEQIDEKRTVLVAFQTADEKLPGEIPEYAAYLQEVLASTKYATGAVPAVAGKTCALCGHEQVMVYPNALRGAGINFANLDRDGAYAGLDVLSAWKYFALCIGCADLLYVYWNHVANDFMTTVAGERALVIPTLNLDPADHKKFIERIKKWVAGIKPEKSGQESIRRPEEQLLHVLSKERAVNTLTLLWAEFGQRIDDVRGVVSEVLPSRVRQLAEFNLAFDKTSSPLYPEIPLDEFQFDVSLSILRPLLHRPGGKKAQRRNESRRLFNLRRDIAEAVYHHTPIPCERFWAEIHETAQWHWDGAVASDQPVYGLLYEGWSEKKNQKFLTTAGWVRQLARFIHYLKMIGVYMPEEKPLYQPQCEALMPYFGSESAIRGYPEAFAFILGTLYGKLLQVQAARGVNVGANALTWLKRLTLPGADLPDLYTKIRNKLLEYERDRQYRRGPIVRSVEAELTELQKHLGDSLRELNEVDTCYFLLLGQAVATKIMPSKKKKGVTK